MDLPGTKLKDLGTLKKLTSGGSDFIEVEKKYGPFCTISSQHIKLVFGSNSPIRLDSHEDPESIKERMLIVPFPYSVPAASRINNLVDHLLDEKDYIIKQSLIAYRKLLENNYVFPPCEAADKLLYQFFGASGNRTMDMFLQSGLCTKDSSCSTTCSDIFNAYESYCMSVGLSPLTYNTFIKTLRSYDCFSNTRIVSSQGRIQGIRGLRIN